MTTKKRPDDGRETRRGERTMRRAWDEELSAHRTPAKDREAPPSSAKTALDSAITVFKERI